MEEPSDPRVFFAAERTLLAWIRTGLTVMAFGFVVARFGLFLRVVAAQPALAPASNSTHLSTYLGVALVTLGVAVLFGATAQHRAFLRNLPVTQHPTQYTPRLALFVAVALAIAGCLLAVYLALGAH